MWLLEGDVDHRRGKLCVELLFVFQCYGAGESSLQIYHTLELTFLSYGMKNVKAAEHTRSTSSASTGDM